MFFSDPQPENYLSYFQVIEAGESYGLSPLYTPIYIDVIPQIDDNMPVFARCRRYDGIIPKHHAVAIRRYNTNSDTYSIWNPWNGYYESMPISTREYIVGDRNHTWVDTVYNWR